MQRCSSFSCYEDPKLILLRQELFLSATWRFQAESCFAAEVQSQVLPKFGFKGDMKGVFDMLERHSLLRHMLDHWQEAFKKPELQKSQDFLRLGCPCRVA